MVSSSALLLLLAAVLPPDGPATTTAAPSTPMPVVIVPGFLGWDRLPVFDRYLETIAAGLEADGRVVVVVQSPAIASSAVRAGALVRAVEQARASSGADRVLILAHSQGGLDTRIALQDDAVRARIGAVATLATPHQGTPVATWGARLPSFLVDGVLMPVQWAWELFEPMEPARRSVADSTAAFSSLSLRPEGASTLQRRGRPDDSAGDDDDDDDDDDVPFFSVAGFTGRLRAGDHSCDGGRWSAPRLSDDVGALMAPGLIVHEVEGWTLANDGIVPAASARYGHFLGCVPADHVDWLGWNDAGSGRPAPFDEVAFGRVLIRGLEAAARDGAPAMDAFVPHLAALARAHPH